MSALATKALNYGCPVNRSHPLMRGIVSRLIVLPLYSSGYRMIDIAAKNHGTFVSSPTWGRPRLLGGYGAVTTNGSSSYVDLGAPTSLELYSLMSSFAWVRSTVASGGSAQICVAKDSNVGSRGYWYGIGNSGNAAFYLEINGGSSTINAGPILANDYAWHRIGFTYDGTTWIGYVDGAQVGTVAAGAPTANSGASWWLGGRQYSGFFNGFTGDIDDVCWWNRCLTARDVLDDWNDGRSGSHRTLNYLKTYSVISQAVVAAGGPFPWYLDEMSGGFSTMGLGSI